MNGINGLEFLRFGSSIPGGYWGCCACCIIQNFKVMPDAPVAQQVVSGDGGTACVVSGMSAYVGLTYEELFETRIRIGTFHTREMPNHAFFAILTQMQIDGPIGKAWLPILKRHGFEFLRTVCNSVYAGDSISDKLPESGGSHRNYIFGLFRNIGNGAIENPFTPPKAWSSIKGSPELIGLVDQKALRGLAESQFDFQLKSWKKGKTKFYTEAECVKAGVPIFSSGVRGGQQPRNVTEELKNKNKNKEPKAPSPFSGTSPAAS